MSGTQFCQRERRGVSSVLQLERMECGNGISNLIGVDMTFHLLHLIACGIVN